MKWKLIGLIPKDGLTIKAEGQEVTLRGAVGKAAVIALPRCLFEGHSTPFDRVVSRAREIAQEITGLPDILAVEEGVEFLRMVPTDLDARLARALGECESCCLDNEADRNRLISALKRELTA